MLGGGAIDDQTVVLIIENNDQDLKLLRQICRKVGFALRNIHDVEFVGRRVTEPLEKALGLVNRGEVDLVLLDLALDDDDDDPMPVVAKIERWKEETRKKTIPVIVVTKHEHVLEDFALQFCEVVIPKPGPTEAEEVYFSKFLKYAIQKAIVRQSNEATFGERLRQQGKRIVQGFHLEKFTITIGWLTFSSRLPNAVAVCLISVSYLVAAWPLAKSFGWPFKLVVGLFAVGLLLFLILARVLKKKE